MGMSCRNCKNQNCFVLKYFSPGDIDIISENKSIRHFKKGELVYRESEVPENVYFIYEGCLKIVKKDHRGSDWDLYFAEPGDLVGYRSVVCSEPHSTSAFVYSDSLMCETDKNYFMNSFLHNREFVENFMKFLSEEIWLRERRIEDLENYKSN